jgi:ATP-binding cassette subfamily F protein 3
VALAQFEGTLVLVSHDRHLLRATTDQLLIVRDGGLQPFDGDLDDYRDWLLGRSTQKAAAPERAPAPGAKEGASRLSERREAAKQRQRQSDVRKPIESRLKRLEAQLAKVNTRKSALDVRLADPTLYEGGDREALKGLLLDQAYAGQEIAQLEAEWLDFQTRREAIDS